MLDTALAAPSSSDRMSVITTSDSVPTVSEPNHVLLEQVERILHSEELRGSEVLRRLLRFLAAKSVSGEADYLKEYTVAIDGLGRPSSYDPRHNSAVRIQVGRLRQKLSDYYRSEGGHDPVTIDIPRGRFNLTFEYRSGLGVKTSSLAEEVTAPPEPTRPARIRDRFARLQLPIGIAAGVILALATGAIYNALRSANAKAATIASADSWNAEMEDLWRPFIAADRPMIVAIEDPLFVELDGKKGVYYRDKTLNTWQDVAASPAVESLRAALKSREMAPSRYYTAFGEVDASFLLARTLGSRIDNLSVLKTSDFSMRELAGNNVVFVGLQNLFFTDQMQSAPVEAPLQQTREGIRNVNPGPNEPAVFLDEYSTAPTEEGTAYALITHVPGPMGNNDVESFTSSRAAGYVAAVKAFTDPNSVRTVVNLLKHVGSGKMPRYYQLLLKVKFRAEEPTEVTYVLAKVLNYPGKS